MRIQISAGGLSGATAKSGLLAIPLINGKGSSEKGTSAHLTEVDRRSGGQLTALRAVGDAPSKRFSFSTAPAGSLPAEQLLFAGLGSAETLDRQAILRWAAAVTRKLAGRNVRRLAIDATPIIAALKGDAPALYANGGASFGAGIDARSTERLDAGVLAVALIVRGAIKG